MDDGAICIVPSINVAIPLILLSSRRNTKSAYCFLGKILNNVKEWQIPQVINTDKAPTYGHALSRLKREGKCPPDLEHRQVRIKIT